MDKIKTRVVETVVYSRPKKKTKADNQVASASSTRNHEEEIKKQEKEMKKLRHEVFKFAVNSLDRSKKVEAKEALAISLGAKVSLKQIVIKLN